MVITTLQETTRARALAPTTGQEAIGTRAPSRETHTREEAVCAQDRIRDQKGEAPGREAQRQTLYQKVIWGKWDMPDVLRAQGGRFSASGSIYCYSFC